MPADPVKPPHDTPSSLQLYLRLLGYTRRYWKVFAVSLAGLVVVASTEPAMPALLRPILDRSFVDKDLEFIKWVPLLLIGLFVVRGVASFISDYCIQWVSQKVVYDLRREMFARLLPLILGGFKTGTFSLGEAPRVGAYVVVTHFDGTPALIWRITERLYREGYNEPDLEKIWGGNVLRVLSAVEAERDKEAKR